MTTNHAQKDLKRLLAEADELVQRINANVFTKMEEEHRVQLEVHAQKIEKIKSKVMKTIAEKNPSEKSTGAEGMHEAFQEIAKAMRELKLFVS